MDTEIKKKGTIIHALFLPEQNSIVKTGSPLQ